MDGTALYCQGGYIALPVNWVVAPDNADTRYVIGAHSWSTSYVVLSNGYGYYTGSNAAAGTAGTLWSSGALCTSGTSHYPCGSCNAQVSRVVGMGVGRLVA